MNQLFDEISRDEGRKRMPYKDTKQIWTAGVGHNIQEHGLPIEMLVGIIRRAGGLSEMEIDKLLELDVQVARGVVDNLYPDWRDLPDAWQRVLVNMAFNMGQTVFSKFKLFWKAIKRRDALEAGRQMEDSMWWGQVGPRAKRLRKMIEEDT